MRLPKSFPLPILSPFPFAVSFNSRHNFFLLCSLAAFIRCSLITLHSLSIHPILFTKQLARDGGLMTEQLSVKSNMASSILMSGLSNPDPSGGKCPLSPTISHRVSGRSFSLGHRLHGPRNSANA
jgi:hypothetical protein